MHMLIEMLKKKMFQDRSKIDIENVLFFNVAFFMLRPRFWSILGQLGSQFHVLRTYRRAAGGERKAYVKAMLGFVQQ